MKSILTLFAFVAVFSFVAGPTAAAGEACLDPCFTKNDSCQKDCATGLHKETSKCGNDTGCVDTVDLNFSSCQKACTDIAKMCAKGCMTTPATAQTQPKPST